MQVACTRCGAQYEFEASAIPAAGYNAQCAHCGNLFFVAPPAPEVPPPAPREPEMVSVTCKHCNAVYQFEASAIPEGGYDAQCTQCQGIFFVGVPKSPPQVEAPAPRLAPIVPARPALEPVPSEPERPATKPAAAVPEGAASRPAARFAVDALAADRPPVDLGRQAVIVPEQGDARDLLALSAALGEPSLSAADGTPEDDFALVLARRRWRWLLAAIIPACALLYVVGTYLLAPNLFYDSVGRFIGLGVTVSPEAVPYFNRATAIMMSDTETGYLQAIAELERAVAIDDHYVDAMALEAMAQFFVGTDLQNAGRQMLTGSEPRNVSGATKDLEQGSLAIAKGFERLKRALAQTPVRPMAHLAAGMYYALDSDMIAKAQEFLAKRLEASGGTSAKLDLNAPPDAWTPLLQGMIDVVAKKDAATIEADFRAALRVEPKLTRARWELAHYQVRGADKTGAQNLLHEILTAVPTHAKALALTAELQKAAAAYTAATVEKPTPPAGPHRKGKMRHER